MYEEKKVKWRQLLFSFQWDGNLILFLTDFMESLGLVKELLE